jgi:cytochrome c biogenesis protein CcmG/thiol:disulfide interchange protein DsbE
MKTIHLGILWTTLLMIILLAHYHKNDTLTSPEARIARRYQAQIVNKPFDDLQLEDAQGNILKLSALREKFGRKQVLLLNFWATWCPPCIEEMPDLEGLAREMVKEDFSIIALSSDDSWAPIQQLLGSEKLQMQIYRDPEGKQFNRYGTEKLPESYVIDKDGIVRLRLISVQPWKEDELVAYFKWLAK